ncbi:hypothetical protein ACHAW5_002830 [Stephanodiscus triporus]|uniref:Uncharacterized protein n=1 Tax=Stephanodiscus triporus TaxID=2934178 RepID=A0ABD3PSQ8_9STRA
MSSPPPPSSRSSSTSTRRRRLRLAAEAFSRASLEIVVDDDDDGVSSSSTSATTASRRRRRQNHRLRAYYRDSSGRARAKMRVRLIVIGEKNDGDGDDEEEEEEGGGGGGGLDALLGCGCVRPAPEGMEGSGGRDDDGGDKDDEDEDEDEDEFSPRIADATLAFECTADDGDKGSSSSSSFSSSSSSSSGWTLEGVSVLRSVVERRINDDDAATAGTVTGIIFDVEVAVRGNGLANTTIGGGGREEGGRPEEGELFLRAVLFRRMDERRRGGAGGRERPSILPGGTIAARILGSEFVGGRAPPPPPPNVVVVDDNARRGATLAMRTPPLRVHATLVRPLRLRVREACGARGASGSTLVEVTVEHPTEHHDEDVTVTGVSFHPGQSRLWVGEEEDYFDGGDGDSGVDDGANDGGDGGRVDGPSLRGAGTSTSSYASSLSRGRKDDRRRRADVEGKSMQGGELSVIDMSRRVRWGYAPGSAPDLPLVLGPHEAFATVMQIDAGEDVRSRAFLSPISVNATIGDGGERIMVAADARWTSSRVGVENSDAFRVDMSLRGGLATACRVGAPLVVSLRVLNLSMEPRDLMLLMAKDGEGRESGLRWERPAAEGRRIRRTGRVDGGGGIRKLLHQNLKDPSRAKESHRFNTAVVSEVNGYTFGVWGLSGDDDGTTRHHRDHELLAVDAALLLGEVKEKGHSTCQI